jgi:hypothetical protein
MGIQPAVDRRVQPSRAELDNNGKLPPAPGDLGFTESKIKN